MPVRKLARAVHADLAFLQRELNQLVARLAELDAPTGQGVGEWQPPVDVYECRGKLTVVMEAPGLAAESLRVACRDGKLVVSGERRERRGPEVAGYLCLERPHGRFTRVLDLGLAVDLAGAEAKLAAGLLVISLPRLKDRRGRETVIPVRGQDS